MKEELQSQYQTDKKVWDACAETYEEQIVSGHPDVLAYEDFEERTLDNILLYIGEHVRKPVKLIDVGCGSGRLHIRYGKNIKIPVLEKVTGIDFSNKMLELARNKIDKFGLNDLFYPQLELVQGSAFELQPESSTYLPVVVNLINSIGVMQGSQGAHKLFKAMRRCVEQANGIAIISCYRKEYIEQYALPQYESTLNVCGQPIWLKPDTYGSDKYTLVPKYYKRAKTNDLTIEVEVYENNKLIKPLFLLFRDKEITRETIESGRIQTYSNYESSWYSFRQFDHWIAEFWNGLPTYHIPTNKIDPKNAEAGQLAVLDAGNHLKGFFKDIP